MSLTVGVWVTMGLLSAMAITLMLSEIGLWIERKKAREAIKMDPDKLTLKQHLEIQRDSKKARLLDDVLKAWNDPNLTIDELDAFMIEATSSVKLFNKEVEKWHR